MHSNDPLATLTRRGDAGIEPLNSCPCQSVTALTMRNSSGRPVQRETCRWRQKRISPRYTTKSLPCWTSILAFPYVTSRIRTFPVSTRWISRTKHKTYVLENSSRSEREIDQLCSDAHSAGSGRGTVLIYHGWPEPSLTRAWGANDHLRPAGSGKSSQYRHLKIGLPKGPTGEAITRRGGGTWRTRSCCYSLVHESHSSATCICGDWPPMPTAERRDFGRFLGGVPDLQTG